MSVIKLFILIGTILLKNGFLLTEKPCIENFSIHYRDTFDLHENDVIVKNVNEKRIEIIFESGFNDTITISANDKKIDKIFIKSNETLGTSGKQIIYYYEKDICAPVITIKCINSKRCFSFSIDPRYRVIYISIVKNGLEGIYSNYYHPYE